MSYTFIELQNMITTDLRENLKISPHELADIIEYLANLIEGGGSIPEYAGILTTSTTDSAQSGHYMFGIAVEQGTYTNLTGNPALTEAFGLFHFNGTSWSNVTSGLIGNKNVQPDWYSQDSSSDAYIKNKDNVKSFTGADLVNRQTTLTNETGSEAPILVLFKDGVRQSPANYQYSATTTEITITVNIRHTAGTIFKYRLL